MLDPIFWRGVTRVGAPYAVIPPEGSAVRLYFTARGAEADQRAGRAGRGDRPALPRRTAADHGHFFAVAF